MKVGIHHLDGEDLVCAAELAQGIPSCRLLTVSLAWVKNLLTVSQVRSTYTKSFWCPYWAVLGSSLSLGRVPCSYMSLVVDLLWKQLEPGAPTLLSAVLGRMTKGGTEALSPPLLPINFSFVILVFCISFDQSEIGELRRKGLPTFIQSVILNFGLFVPPFEGEARHSFFPQDFLWPSWMHLLDLITSVRTAHLLKDSSLSDLISTCQHVSTFYFWPNIFLTVPHLKSWESISLSLS